jgi:hypothetical protein
MPHSPVRKTQRYALSGTGKRSIVGCTIKNYAKIFYQKKTSIMAGFFIDVVNPPLL